MELVDTMEKIDRTTNVKNRYQWESKHMMAGQLRNHVLRTLYKVDAPGEPRGRPMSLLTPDNSGNRSACPSIYTNLLSFRSSSSSIAINIPQTSSFLLKPPALFINMPRQFFVGGNFKMYVIRASLPRGLKPLNSFTYAYSFHERPRN